MTLNTEKSKIVRFTKARGREPKKEWHWKGEIIEKVKSMKYLEYIFHKNGNYDFHACSNLRYWTEKFKNSSGSGCFFLIKQSLVCCYMLRRYEVGKQIASLKK